ncbi:MAG: transposase family protein [Spirochaetes bacterium]|nr:transposase family protein [Spirochaetota bacterium]
MLIALRNSAHRWVKEGAESLKQLLPYKLLGVDTDNGFEFINKQLFDWCTANGITFTRSRSYHKNDNCFVEQKNDYGVRRFVGYMRYDSDQEFEALKKVYSILNLLLNYFYPTQKILSKTRIGAIVRKTYEQCKTPYERLLESPLVPQASKLLAMQQMEQLSIVELKQKLDRTIADLVTIHKNKRNSA